jgi:hypothetical protein
MHYTVGVASAVLASALALKGGGERQVAIALSSAGLTAVLTICKLNKYAAAYEARSDVLKHGIDDFVADPTLDDKFLAAIRRAASKAYDDKLK